MSGNRKHVLIRGIGMKEKNNFVEFLRFVFCCIIVVHHSLDPNAGERLNFFVSGALAVEFFYIVTGYFAIKHVEEKKDSINGMVDATKYTVRKLQRLLPYTVIAILGAYLFDFIAFRHLPLIERLMRLQNLPSEILMMPMTGQITLSIEEYRCAQLWFLSSMLLALPLVIYACRKFNDVFKGYLVWFLPSMLLFHLANAWGSIAAWNVYENFFFSGTIRAIADLMLGGAAYYAVRFIKEKAYEPKAAMRVVYTFCEFAMLVFVVLSCHRSSLTSSDQLFVTGVIWTMLVISLSGISYTGKMFSGALSPLWRFLGNLSMPVFCLHWTVFKYLGTYLGDPIPYYGKLALQFVIGAIFYLVISKTVAKIKKRPAKTAEPAPSKEKA